MQFNKRQLTGLLVVAVLLVSAAGPALAAAPTVDSESTDTSTTSDWTDGTTVSNFNASSSQYSWVEAQFDSDNPKIKIIDPDSGDVVQSYTASDMTETNASNDYYAANISHDELATVPMDAGEQKNITVQFVNNTQVDNPDLTNITVTLNNTNERAVVRAGSDATSTDLAEVTTEEASSLAFWVEAADISELDASSVGVNGTETTVYVVYANDSVASPYETAAEGTAGFLGFGSSDYEEGDRIGDHQTLVDDQLYVTYSEAAPDEVADKDEATYSEYVTLNGEPTHKITLGSEDFDDATSVDVMTVGNQAAGGTFDFIPGLGPNMKSYEDGGLLAGLGL